MRGEGREKERESNIDVREKHRLAAFCTRSDCNPGVFPDLGIEPATFWFAGQSSTNGATWVRVNGCILRLVIRWDKQEAEWTQFGKEI